jgi:hypothetical protein
MKRFLRVLVIDPIPFDYDHEHEQEHEKEEEKSGVNGARTRNLRRDRAAL